MKSWKTKREQREIVCWKDVGVHYNCNNNERGAGDELASGGDESI